MRIHERSVTLSSGRKLRLASPRECDAKAICELRTLTTGESEFLVRYPDECLTTVEETREMVSAAERSETDFSIAAFDGERLVGETSVGRCGTQFKLRHRASLGIAIADEYCSQGLGRKMLSLAIAQARENGFEQLELGVASGNERAAHLYESLGFERCGLIPRAMKLRSGGYYDEIEMVLFL